MHNSERKPSSKRVKMRYSRRPSSSSSLNLQYFLWSQVQGTSKPLFAISVIILCILQLSSPCYSSAGKSTDDKLLSQKIVSKNGKAGNENPTWTGNSKIHDVDVVGFGEDCSLDGPFCDETRHLICDLADETCICDEKQGYVNIYDVPGGMEQHLLIENDENGNPVLDLTGNVCISKQEIIERTEMLLGLSKNQQNDAPPMSIHHPSYLERREETLVEHEDENDGIFSPPPSKESNGAYDKFMKMTEALSNPEYNAERLEKFKLNSKQANAGMSEKELIIKEILKYRIGKLGLNEFKKFLNEILDLFYNWRTNKLSNSICSLIFDIDRDEIFTHEEYVIALLSDNIRELVIPKIFLNLIGPLIEESCISKEDLQALDHNPDTLLADFYIMDVNGDGCFSWEEFSKYANETCWVNWFREFVTDTELNFHLDVLDPSPEEMYIRRVMQNERLSINWNIVDKDKDGTISFEELYLDLAPFGFTPENNEAATDALMEHLDKNKNGRVSIDEVKLQMLVPDLNEEYQFEWLESLYELYETDEDEVQEYVEALNESYDNWAREERADTTTNPKEIATNPTTNRIFEIFDRNSDGEMDEVEFKLLMELMKKYVVYDLLNDTVDSIDMNSDRKVTVFEYQEFFKNASTTFRIYFKNLLALEEELEMLESGKEDDDDVVNSGDYETSGEEESEGEEAVSSTKLSKRAALSNETVAVYKLFTRLDANSDGFITKEDFYTYASSYKAKKSTSELKEEFLQLDLDKDGVLTTNDAEDYVVPTDFNKFKDTADAFSEEVFPGDLEAQFPLVDVNMDGRVQKEEFQIYKGYLFGVPKEEKDFLEWIEDYLAKIPSQLEKESEIAFAEFDTNCDRFISKAEFTTKLHELRKKNKESQVIAKWVKDSSLYFNILDLNKDGKVSHNEFQLLLLRTGKKLNVR